MSPRTPSWMGGPRTSFGGGEFIVRAGTPRGFGSGSGAGAGTRTAARADDDDSNDGDLESTTDVTDTTDANSQGSLTSVD